MTKSAQPEKVKEEQVAPDVSKKDEAKKPEAESINNKAKAREYLLRAKLYKFSACVFLGMGIVIFGYIYSERANGQFMKAMADPAFVFYFTFPFMPAVVLSYMAKKAEKKVHDFLKEP